LKRSFATVRVPMMFPVENRPIILAPVADMTYKALNAPGSRELEKLATAILKVCERYGKDDRILVHTHSYDLASKLYSAMYGKTKRRLVTYGNGRGEKDRAFEEYANVKGAVFLAPSMDRGVDFKGDLARVVIVAKMPFASLGDRQVSARLIPSGRLFR
jgi:Rad3-related DNA helicase